MAENSENPILDREMQQILAQCYLSTEKFAKFFMPERFWRPFSPIHKAIFEIIDDDSIKQAVIAAPRGIGKSTIMDIVLPAKRILFRDSNFVILIGASETNATQQTENLKEELTTNEQIVRFFGPMKSASFSKDEWVTGSGIKVMPRGAGQKVRGLLYGKNRPDLIIVDDLENDENVESEDQRAKLKRWFHSAVANSIDRGKPYRIIVIGTVLHEASLLSELLEDKEWKSIRLSICDESFHSNYPTLVSDTDLARLVQGHRDRGTLDVFYREYMNLPIASENQKFTQAMFRHYTEDGLRFKNANSAVADRVVLENVILIDPAKSKSSHSDFSAIGCVGIDRKRGDIYLRDLKMERLHPDEILNESIDMATRWGAKVIGLEVTGLNEFVTYPFRNQMFKAGKFFELVELKAKGDKRDRISALVPFYKQGLIHHNTSCCAALEAQLLSFPRGKHDDGPDMLAYIVEMFDLGDVYFNPEGEADEYKELEEEDRLQPLGDWRYC